MGRNTLEARLCILIAGLLFALLLSVGYFQVSGERRILVDESTSRYESLMNALALTGEPVMRLEDAGSYRRLTSRLMRADPDIAYVAITDRNDRVVFLDTRKMGARKNSTYAGRPLSRVIPDIERFSGDENGEFRRLRLPITPATGLSGCVNLGLSVRSMMSAAQGLQARLLAVSAVALMLAILISMLLARAIVNPIRSLTRAVRAVSDGRLDVAVPISGNDEIAELGRAFNGMVTALKTSHEHLTERANTDSLTGLYNHRYFHDRLSAEFSSASRHGRPLSIVMLDIDHFKTVNDTHGHPFGDEVLQNISSILVRECRAIDHVARYGGEEFAIILPETRAEDAFLVAERVRLRVQSYRFTENDGSCVPVTISLGISQYPLHGRDKETLVMAADLAMYRSKALGRNLTTTFSTEVRTGKVTDSLKLHLLLNQDDISTMQAMAAAVDAKSHRPRDFAQGVMNHCAALGAGLGLSGEEIRQLRIASLLYDVGKLAIDGCLLMKPGKLTAEELSIIRSHPALGYAIVQKSVGLKPVLPAILHHHECWDGTGYPNGLKGEDIPLAARIVCIVDAYHAMTTDRPHCKASTREAAIAELKRCSGTQFDPDVVEWFMRILSREAPLSLHAPGARAA